MFGFRNLSKWDRLLFTDLVLFFLLNLFWIVSNNSLYSWDQSVHASIALYIADLIKNGFFSKILRASSYYPIFAHLLASIPVLLFGPNIKFVQIVATFMSMATLFIIYKYFSLITGNPRAAFVSVAIFSLFPVVFDNSHWLMLDIPMTGMFFLSLYFLEKSKNLIDYRYSISFFVSLGLLLLTKWTGALIIILPLFFTFVKLIKKNQAPNIKGISIGMVCFLIITLPWYITNFEPFIAQASLLNLGAFPGLNTANNISVFSALEYYPRVFINIQANFLIAISFLISLPIFLKLNLKNKWFILISIVYGYIIFTLIPNKVPRYIMPYLPFATLLIAMVFDRLKNRKLADILCWGLILISFLYLSLLDLRPKQIEGYRLRISNPPISLFNINDNVVKKYDSSDWKLGNILEDIEDKSGGRQINIEVGLTYPYINVYVLKLYLLSKQYEGKFTNLVVKQPQAFYLKPTNYSYIFPDSESIRAYLGSDNFVLLSSGNIGGENSVVQNRLALIQLRDYVLKNYKVKDRKDYALPNGKVANLYFF